MSDFSITPKSVLPQVEILASYVIKLENQMDSLEQIKIIFPLVLPPNLYKISYLHV